MERINFQKGFCKALTATGGRKNVAIIKPTVRASGILRESRKLKFKFSSLLPSGHLKCRLVQVQSRTHERSRQQAQHLRNCFSCRIHRPLRQDTVTKPIACC